MFLGVIGLKGHGKDTVAEILRPYGFKRVAFSDPLYSEVAQAFGVSVQSLQLRETKESPLHALALQNCKDQDFVNKIRELVVSDPTVTQEFPSLSGRLWPSTPLSPRFVLQRWGTDYRREFNDGYWLDKAEQAYLRNTQESYVLTDVRFPNEYGLIKSRGGKILRVFKASLKDAQNPKDAFLASLPELEDSLRGAHCSETSLLRYPADVYLPNVWGLPEVLSAHVKQKVLGEELALA